MSTPEMDKSMGRASDYQSGPSGFKGASLPADKDVGKVTPEHKLGASMVEHLKSLLNIADKEPVPNGGLDALNKGLKDAQ